jgi:hypothetical protein
VKKEPIKRDLGDSLHFDNKKKKDAAKGQTSFVAPQLSSIGNGFKRRQKKRGDKKKGFELSTLKIRKN